YEPYKSYSHTLDDFDNPTLIAENPRENIRPYAVTWTADKSTIYALSREDDKYLITIDPETGISTRLSRITGFGSNQSIQGMAIDENNTCYLVATDNMNHDTNSYLYTCNLFTGEVTLVGSQSIAPDLHDIAATCDGDMYGIDAASKSLYKLNKSNGAAELVGSVGVSRDVGLYTLSYDRQNDQLYQYVISDSGIHTALATLSKTNGQLTYVSEFFQYGIFVGGVQSSCEDRGETFQLNAGFNGSWINPATSGQGLMVDVFPVSDVFFAAWFTFDDGQESNKAAVGSIEQRWLTLSGAVGDDNTVELDIYNSSGGVFDDPAAVDTVVVGSMTVTFEDCTSGFVEYIFADSGLSGSFPIQRIAGDNIAMCESLLSESSQ
ncbi:MAG: DUF6923 family protein, partial [Marinicella sp.]